MPGYTGSIAVLAPIPSDALAPLRDRLNLVEVWRDPLGLLTSVPDRERIEIAFTIGNRPFTREIIELLPALRFVCHFGIGTDQLDLATLRDRGVLVTNTAGASASCVADLAVTMLLSLVRTLPQADAFVRHGDWSAKRFPYNASVGGRKVGIYGLGEIGVRIATRLAAFETEVAYHSRSPRAQVPYRHFSSLQALAEWSDDLVVAVSATSETVGSVDRRVLTALGKGYVVNVARGSIVDEDALIEALQRGVIAGAGLDTFQNEPVIRDEFLELENVILSPHVGGGTARAIRNTTGIFLANLRRYLEGEEPQNVVR